jgi:hypothetical protein
VNCTLDMPFVIGRARSSIEDDHVHA